MMNFQKSLKSILKIFISHFIHKLMSIEGIVEKKKSIQNALLEFLEDESDAEDKFSNFINFISTKNY